MITRVHDWFRRSAAAHPDKPAVSCRDETLTYAELDRASDAVAAALHRAGVPARSLVPFFLPKGVEAIQAILGILKADCAYVPLDVGSPGARLESILRAADAPVLVVDAEGDAKLDALLGPGAGPPRLRLDRMTEDGTPPPSRAISVDLAYVLFTSGSTGVPKGVMIPHRAIIDYIDWCVETYELTGDDVISNHAPLYFDNSTFDLYTAFHTGATLHLVPDELNAVIPRLVKWLRERQVTTFFCVPSVMRMLLRSRRLKADSFPALRHVIAAGEVLPPDVVSEWMALYPHIQFTNMYGPTEITVDCTFHRITEPPTADEPVPIGKARSNMELFVRGEDGSLSLEPGAEGELLVRGTSVAYGYLGDPDRTAAAFIQNPLHDRFPDPLYRTGDLVRVRHDGALDFIGRADHQVKLLGHRIELGEVEAALAGVETVSECVVVFRREEPQEIGALVAVMDGEDAAGLRRAAQERLPGYMVPTAWVLHDGDFPRTPNGKYDRKAAARLVFGD